MCVIDCTFSSIPYSQLHAVSSYSKFPITMSAHKVHQYGREVISRF